LPRTLFIVASKSGSTIETQSHFAHFWEQVSRASSADAGKQFIAITDAGTKLDKLAQEHGFRAIFRNPADIGGRDSRRSFFGLVPAAIIGANIEQLLDRAETMAHACDASRPARENPGLWLGAVMGTLALQKRDKVTLVVSPPIGTFGYWVEQ